MYARTVESVPEEKISGQGRSSRLCGRLYSCSPTPHRRQRPQTAPAACPSPVRHPCTAPTSSLEANEPHNAASRTAEQRESTTRFIRSYCDSPLPPLAPIATLSPLLNNPLLVGSASASAPRWSLLPSSKSALPLPLTLVPAAPSNAPCPHPKMVWWTSVSNTRKKHSLQTAWPVLGRRIRARRGASGGHSEHGAIVVGEPALSLLDNRCSGDNSLEGARWDC